MQGKCIGIVGAGNRGQFLVQLLLKLRPEWRCGMVIDPHPPSLGRMLVQLGDRSIPTSTSFDAAHTATKIDAWIMAAHERQHLDAAHVLFPLGKPIYFEKPIARNLSEGRELIRLQKQHSARVMVGYECRWAPFYRRAREIIASGRLGRIVHLAAEERLEGGFFAAGWLRGPWRLESESGSLLLTKCIHDIDYITWLLDAMPTHVSSYAGRRAFLPEPRAPQTCNPCTLRKSCHYSPENWSYPSPWKGGPGDKVDLECVFNGPGDIVDHQEVSMLFRGGIHASFQVSAPYARSERRLRVAGTEAWLEGNMEDGELKILPCHGGEVEPVDLEGVKDDSHGGGDRRILADFIEWIENPESKPHATLEEGFRGLAIACAADDSRRALRVLKIDRYLAC